MTETKRTVLVVHGEYELVTYPSGESWIEHRPSMTASAPLHYTDQARIEADPSLMAAWELDLDITQ